MNYQEFNTLMGIEPKNGSIEKRIIKIETHQQYQAIIASNLNNHIEQCYPNALPKRDQAYDLSLICSADSH